MKLNINTQEEAIHFVDICNKYRDSDIDLIFQRFIVDAKSILGVMAIMGNGKNLEVSYHGTNDFDKFIADIADYIAK